MGQLRIHNTSTRGVSVIGKKNTLQERAKRRPPKRGHLHKELQMRIGRKKRKLATLHKSIQGEKIWVDLLKEWCAKHLSEGAQIVVGKMLAKGYRYPLRCEETGASDRKELLDAGVVVEIEGYIIISKKKRILSMLKK